MFVSAAKDCQEFKKQYTKLADAYGCLGILQLYSGTLQQCATRIENDVMKLSLLVLVEVVKAVKKTANCAEN